MLTAIIGKKDTERKTQINKKLSEYLQSESRIILLVPDQSAFERERNLLLHFGAGVASRVWVCGFSRLSENLLSEAGIAVKPQIDETGRSVLMSLAVESVRDSLRLYASHAGRGSLMLELLSLRDELRQAALAPSGLLAVSSVVQSASLAEKTKELGLIFCAYDALLTKRFSDKSDNITVLTDVLRETDLLGDSVLLLDDFRGFTGQQILCLEQLMRHCRETVVVLCAEPFAETESDGVFAHTNRTLQTLYRIARDCRIQIREEVISDEKSTDAIGYLRDALYNPYAEKYTEPTNAITLVTASDKFAECDFVASEAARLLREEGYRARDIAVVERSPGIYTESIVSSLRRYAVPCFEDKRKPLGSFPLIRLVLTSCDLAGKGLRTELLLRMLKTGLCGIAEEECALLENYGRLWQIDGERWKQPFTGHPDGFGASVSPQSEAILARLNSIREKAVSPILALRACLRDGDGRDACAAVYAFLQRVQADKNLREFARKLDKEGNTSDAIECGRIWDVLMELLDALAETLSSVSVSASRFAELLHIMTDVADVGEIPQGIDEVSVGSADRMRLHTPKAVFAVGVNEGVFPAPAVTGGLLTAQEKALLREAEFVLGETTEHICDEERLLAYSVLTAPSQRLYLSQSQSDLHGATMFPSELFKQMQTLYPHCLRINTADRTALELTAGVQTAFENAALLYRANTPEAAAFRSLIRSYPDYADRLAAVDRTVGGHDFRLGDGETAERLFGTEINLSPSGIETFHKCSMQYFCRYGLKLEPPKTATLSASVNGLLIHYILEMLFRHYPVERLAALTEEELREEIEKDADSFIEEKMGGTTEMPMRLRYQLERVKQTAFEIARRLQTEIGNCRFTVRDTEMQIGGRQAEIPGYTVTMPDGNKLTVSGIVDRVDVMDDGGNAYVRVVDYKTGGKDFVTEDVREGLNLQMLLYLLCIWDHGGTRYGNVIPAGVLYLPAKTGSMLLGRHDSEEAVQQQKIKNGRMNGLVLENETVIYGMDATGKGRFVNASVDANGVIKGNTTPLEGFVALHQQTDEVLRKMGQRLLDGDIEALPVDGGTRYANLCAYCGYADICCREEGAPVRPIGTKKKKGDDENGLDN